MRLVVLAAGSEVSCRPQSGVRPPPDGSHSHRARYIGHRMLGSFQSNIGFLRVYACSVFPVGSRPRVDRFDGIHMYKVDSGWDFRLTHTHTQAGIWTYEITID